MNMKTDQMHYDSHDLRIIENTGLLREDAGESVFFARQLEYVRSKTYDVEYVNLSAMELFPIDTSVPAGAKTITWRQWDGVGAAKIIANYADDIPRVDVQALETTTPVRSVAVSYGYDVQEIRHAQFAGVALDAKRAAQARKAVDEAFNRYAWNGDAISGLPGFLSNTNIPAVVLAADGTGASKLWSTKTSDQIIRDMNAVVNSIFTVTKGIHRATDLWMPLSQYAYISSTPRSSTSDTTILAYFLANNPFVKTVKPVFELTGAGAGGTDRMIAAENSIDNYQMNIVMPFMQHPPQPRNLYFEVPCEARFGGVTIERPLAFAYADGL
jgi:hypothetical protein